MPLKIIESLGPEWFTPAGFEEDSEPPQFKIRPLSQLRYLEVLNSAYIDKNGEPQLDNEQIVMALRYGVVGWRNVQRSNGTAMPFSLANLEKLPASLLGEIATEIISRSELSEDQEKNS